MNPDIIIESPINVTYTTNNLTRRITVETYKTGYDGGPAYNESRLFTYSLDGKTPESLTITNATVAPTPGGDVFFECSAPLTGLIEGTHNLTVRVVFDYPPPGWDEPYSYHTESNATANFTVDTTPGNISTPMSYPEILVISASAAFVAIVATTLLIYYYKHTQFYIEKCASSFYVELCSFILGAYLII